MSTLLYVANWHFIVSNQGYFFQAAAPPPLLHTWSLAVEEQYYLIWPVVALLVFRRWGRRALAVTAGVGALASAGLMLSMLLAGFSPDRLYYGTDTRAQALLIGSFLGAVGSHAGDHFSIVPSRWTRIRHSRYLWSVPGVLGAAFLLWAWHVLDGQNGFLYRGGFLLVAVAAGAIIVTCVTVPTSAMPRFLSLGALVFIGRISYGLYLYHWPLFLVINHAHTGLLGFPLLASRLAATFAAATASWYLIEEPIRTGVGFKGRRGVAVTGAVATLVVGCGAGGHRGSGQLVGRRPGQWHRAGLRRRARQAAPSGAHRGRRPPGRPTSSCSVTRWPSPPASGWAWIPRASTTSTCGTREPLGAISTMWTSSSRGRHPGNPGLSRLAYAMADGGVVLPARPWSVCSSGGGR